MNDVPVPHEAERLESRVRDLLAVIHRDGGHHTTQFGLERSIKDAEFVVLEDRVRLDDLRYVFEKHLQVCK